MFIIGHRGASGLAPENSISSFQKAQELAVDMIETDLRLIAGVITATHNRIPKSATAPVLSEILAASKIPLNLEVKDSGFEAQLLEAIKNFPSEVLLSSKKLKVLKKIRALDGNVKLALVLGKANFFLLPFVPRLDKTLKLYSVHIATFLSSSAAIKFLQSLGKKVYVWTVNSVPAYEKLQRLSVDGVFTDRPDIIKKA